MRVVFSVLRSSSLLRSCDAILRSRLPRRKLLATSTHLLRCSAVVRERSLIPGGLRVEDPLVTRKPGTSDHVSSNNNPGGLLGSSAGLYRERRRHKGPTVGSLGREGRADLFNPPDGSALVKLTFFADERW